MTLEEVKLKQKIEQNAKSLFVDSYRKLCIDNDKVFAILLGLQWIGAIVVALVVTPRTWIGEQNLVHMHVIAAVVLGGALSLFPIFFNIYRPGHVANRYINVIAQGLYSAFFIHLTGGRIETHFHVFGSLAFFAFYRNIPILLTGTVIVAVDHLIRGIWYPQSAFGIFTETNWRWLEHAGWVVFEDFFLGYSCIRGIAEMKIVALKRAESMANHEIAEQLVETRTGELKEERNQLDKTNKAISTIYKNVRSGFLLIDDQTRILDGYTDSCKQLLGLDVHSGMALTSCLNLTDRQANHFQLMVEQVFEDILPEAASLEQIPQRHHSGALTLKLEGSVVRMDEGAVKAILLTISDITELEKTERENITNKALISILQQKGAFVRYVDDAHSMITDCYLAVKNGENNRVRFLMHSLKGNSTVFGLEEIAALIHRIEDQSVILEEHVAEVEERIKDFLNANSGVLNVAYGQTSEQRYSITPHQIGSLGRSVKGLQNAEAAGHAVTRWVIDLKRKPATELLGPIVKMGVGIAERLEKNATVELKNPEVMLDAEILRPVLQNLSHLIRNSIDHGIEIPSQRGSKSTKGKVTIDCGMGRGHWYLRVEDDGRGIDTDKVIQKSLELKLITGEQVSVMTEREKQRLIFADGLSTAEAVTYISGRGVGMSAVLDSVRAVNGTIEVSSQLGKGTVFMITVPLDPMEGTREFELEDKGMPVAGNKIPMAS